MSTPTSGYIDNEAHAACPPNPELDTGAEFHSCEHCKDFTLDFGLTDEELDEMLRNRLKDSLTATELTTTIIEEVKEMTKGYAGLGIFSIMRDMLRNRVTGSLTATVLTTTIIEKVKEMTEKYAGLGIFGVMRDMLGNRVKGLLTAIRFTTTTMKEVKKIRDRHGGLAVLSDTRDQIAQKASTGCKFYAFLSLATRRQTNGANGILCAVLSRECSSLAIHHVHGTSFESQSISLCVPRDNPLAGNVLNRPITADPWSENSKILVTRWMKDCYDTRELCQSGESFFLPSYLIELSPCLSECSSGCPSDCCGFTLRLVKTTQGPISYAALSYCWGSDHHFKTTKSNIHNLLHNIRYKDMPATLRDAAKVAFDLNFRFLWIDALCLIQDPREDEIHTMIAEIPNIYRYATLTIAARSSKSVNEGFLNPRHVKDFEVEKRFDEFGLHNFQIAVKDLFGKSGFAMVNTYEILERRTVPIIETRGWTLQEQVLSKRYLSFSKTGTRWQFYGRSSNEGYHADGGSSNEGYHSDGGSSNEGYHADGGNITKRIASSDSISLKWHGLQSLKSPKTTRKHRQLWLELVAQYMQRELTIPKDRPIAISALASGLGDANDYVAGLWLSDLCHGLSWIPVSPQKEAVVGYYAPSWSWWSVTTSLVWLETKMDHVHQEPMFRLVGCHSSLAHARAPFGYLVEASLRVEARCGRVLVSHFRQGTKISSIGLRYGTSDYVCLNSVHRRKMGVICDWKDGFAKGQVLYLLVLFISKRRMSRICGLVLIDVEDNGSKQDRKYRRVGVFDEYRGQRQDDETRFVEWLGKQPVETLTLV